MARFERMEETPSRGIMNFRVASIKRGSDATEDDEKKNGDKSEKRVQGGRGTVGKTEEMKRSREETHMHS